MTLPPNLRNRILQDAATPSPTREVTAKWNALALALGLTGTLGLWLAIGGVVMGARTVPYTLVLLGPLAIALVWGGYVAILRKGVEPPSFATCIAATLVLLVALPIGVAGGHLTNLDAAFASGPRYDLMCALLGAALGLPFAASVVWVQRHQLAIRGAYLAGMLGAVAFGVGGLVMVLRCTCVDGVHMVFGHALPLIAMTGLVAWVGRMLLLRFAQSTLR